MAKLTHATGELDIQIEGMDVDRGQLIVLGTLGVWKARISVPPHEVGNLVRLVLAPRVLAFLLSLPLRSRRRE